MGDVDDNARHRCREKGWWLRICDFKMSVAVVMRMDDSRSE